ncbi:hypothetical protein DL768_005514 [Monosporascus sp. mg162]|nr:hypothetical protein DL768_005514 [Monosporascus sp. mg162]
MSRPSLARQLPEVGIKEIDTKPLRDNGQVKVAVDEEYYNLGAPKFNEWNDYAYDSDFHCLGIGYRIKLAGRRGCARAAVESSKRASFHANVFGVRTKLSLRARARFKAGRYEEQVDTYAGIRGPDFNVDYGNKRVSVRERGKQRTDKKSIFNTTLAQNVPGLRPNIYAEIEKTTSAVRDTTAEAPGHPRMLESPPITANGLQTNTDVQKVSTVEPDLEKQPVGSDTEPSAPKNAIPKKPKPPKHFVVIGIFSPSTGIPRERVIFINNPKRLFRSVWWGAVRLRGIGGLISLKHVTSFSLYECDPFTPQHTRHRLNGAGEQIMAQLYQTYRSWKCEDTHAEQWMKWIHEELNHSYFTPAFDMDNKDEKQKMLSIELVLDWADSTSIQTAWTVASYIATAGALLAAVLGFLSGISSK